MREKIGKIYFKKMTPFDYLNTSIKSYQRVSSLHGIGLFALIDIKKGETLFPKWEGETNWYRIQFKEAKLLPKEVLAYILRSYESKIENDDSYITFKLVKDTNFLFTEPMCLLNSKEEKGNVNSYQGISLVDIKKDEELYGNYGLTSQKILL